jgi:Ca2+-binding RTX toxin-like protein
MPAETLDRAIEAWLARARAAYIAANAGTTAAAAAAAAARFDVFLKLIREQQGIVISLNRAFKEGFLSNIAYDPTARFIMPAQYDAETRQVILDESASIEAIKYLGLLTEPDDDRVPILRNGIITFGNSLLTQLSDPATAAKAAATAAYIVAHEIGHALTAKEYAYNYAFTVNKALAFIEAEQAKIDLLPPAQRANASINVTAELKKFVVLIHENEGRAALYAYNAWIDTMKAQGKTQAQIDAARPTAFGDFSNRLLDDAQKLLPTLKVDPVTGKILDEKANWEILGVENEKEQPKNAVTYNVLAVGVALATMAYHKSTAILEFNARELGFTNDQSGIEASLSEINKQFWAGEARIRDTSSNKTFLIVKSGKGGNAVVTPMKALIDEDPSSTNEIYLHLFNSDGQTIYDLSQIYIKKNPDGSWFIEVKDFSGLSKVLTPEEFRAHFGRSIEEVFDEARNAAASGRTPDLKPVSIRLDENGNIVVTTINREKLLPGGVRLVNLRPVDYLNRSVTYEYGADGKIKSYFVTEAGVKVTTTLNDDLEKIATNISINGNRLGIEFSTAGALLGAQLGTLLADGNKLVAIVTSAALKTVGDNLGDMLDGLIGRQSIDHAARDAFGTFAPELLNNLKASGVGALSSYLTAELISAIGLEGFAGQLAGTAAGTVINTIISNLAGLNGAAAKSNPLGNIGLAAIPNAIGAFLGTALASKIVTFDTIGGQIGSAIGSSLGTLVAGSLLVGGSGSSATLLGLQLGAFAGPIGAAIGAFVGYLIGGAIGSLFGGTPRSGADVTWDRNKEEFVVTNLYSKKGGSKDAAKAMATAAAETFNAVLSAAGGTLLAPDAVQAGNYGMRKKDYVYRPVSSRDEDTITQRFEGPDGAKRLIGYGVYQALTDPDFKIAGGDIYVKRALYNSFANGGLDPRNFDPALIVGNITIAQRYETYLAAPTVINALIAAKPDSVFAAEWAITFVRAVELGLTRRHESDWYGGFTFLLDEAGANAAGVVFDLMYDSSSGKVGRLMIVGGDRLHDTIDSPGQTMIQGTAADDIISLAGSQLLATNGAVNANLKVNDEAHNGQALEIGVAAIIDGGEGNDVIHASDRGDTVLAGAGNDTIYGGRLDDWIFGGKGDDIIHAGSQAGGRGGDGNYLSGGFDNDQLFGREGSDWLEGGDGVDSLEGGGGDDILAGGAGDGDSSKGGHGNDQYIVRRDDGADTADEAAGGTIVGTSTAPGVDRIQARYAAIAAGLLGRNWLGDAFDLGIAASVPGSASVAAVAAGGEDAIVFGQGIDIGDVRLSRLGGTNGADLLIQVMTIDETGTEVASGTQLVVKDWFADPFKRVEWLKFADGTEIRLGDITSFVAGTGGNDVLIGTDGNDFVYGGAGNDELRLLGGNDIGNGGTGNDLVSGDDGADLVIGGLGIDRLIGGRGKDALSGDGGDDDLYGGADADILSGGKGDDQVVGGAGDDIFKFTRGDGRDTIFDNYSAHWSVVWSASGGWGAGYVRNEATGEITAPDGSYIRKDMDPTDEADLQWFGRFDYDYTNATLYRFDQAAAGTASVVNAGTDTIEFGLGISIQDIVLTRTSPTSPDLVMTISDENAELASYTASGDSITLKNWYLVPGQIEKFAFYQTGILATGAGNYNLVAGTDAANGTTSSPLAGTAGKDWITGGSGDDFIAGGASDDIVNGNSGFDTLRGDAGADVLYGGSGEDSLDGGDGADVLSGGTGIDTATYASSSAVVRAYLGASWANAGAALGDSYASIENLTGGTFGGLYPTEKPGDVLGGDEGDNELTGGRGDDRLLGGAGDDTYMWNGADWYDTIEEGAFAVEEAVTTAGTLSGLYAVTMWEQTGELRPDGSSSYWRLQVAGPGGEIVYDWDKFAPVGTAQPSPATWDSRGWLGGFARTNGQQVIREKFDTSADGGQDVIEMGAGISLSDLMFFRSGAGGFADETGSGLTIRYGSSLDSIWIKNHFTAWGAVETLQFRDGLSISLAHVISAGTGATVLGTDESELISADGATGAETFSGMGGNDVLSGLRGNDVLQGGDGDDVLEGGVGADMLDGGANSATGANWGDTARYVKSTAVNVDLRRPTGQLGGEAAGDILTGIENVVGSATGADTISGDDGGNRLDGLDGNNVVHGWGGDDVVIAGAGADMLYGDDGDDAVSGAEGADQLWGGLGDDRLAGGVGADKLYGEAGKDVLTGGDNDDSVLDGGDGDDDILGEAGNDALIGGAGNDLLVGGAGNDNLQGGEGNDRYLLEAGSGIDTLTDVSGINNILLGEGIGFDRLWLTQVNQDLRIAVIGTSDVLTVTSFFAAGGASLVRSLQTSAHALYLDHPAVRTLITAMTAASAGSTPASMPADIAAILPAYWHEGGKAAPAAPTERTISVNEDTPTFIDGSVGVVDQDNNIVSYGVKSDAGPAHGSITVTDPATGALTYTPSADFAGEDRFSLIVTDADGQSAEIPFRVSVANVNDAPTALRTLTGDPLAVAEYAPDGPTAVGTAAGWLAATDPEGDPIVWSLVQDAGERFEISASGLLSVKQSLLLDREVSDSHVVRIRATDIHGAWAEQDFAVAILDVNEANAFGPIPGMAIGENMAAGTSVGTVPAATDVDFGIFGEQRYYFWNGTTAGATSVDGLYTIEAVSGTVRVNGPVDLEDGTPSRTYTVIARDNAGGTGFNQASASLTITVQDVNEPNAFGPIPDMAIAENVAAGTVVGSVPAATDPDGGAFAEQRYYFLSDSAVSSLSSDGRYAINAVTGTITSNAPLDHEAMSAPTTYVVAARDNQGAAGYNQAEASVTIRVGDVNETNSLAAPSPFTIGENAAIGATVGTIAATDQDLPGSVGGTQRYYFLHGTAASGTSFDNRYSIDAVTGAIRTASALDHETMSLPVTYQVIARDNAGGPGYHEAQTSVVIGVADVNEANGMAASFGFGVNENVGLGTVVGTVVASDPDDPSTAYGQQRFYFLNGASASAISSDGRYAIDAISGTIKTNAALDRETMTAPATYTVIARDNQGAAGYNQASASVTIGVGDVNEANGLAAPAPFTIGENAAVGTTVGAVTATDQDLPGTVGGTQRYYFLHGTIVSDTSFDNRYRIDAVTGAIKTATTLDHETMSLPATYQVVARDNAGGAGYHEAQASVVIGVADVNEPNSMAASFGFGVNENVGLGTVVGTVAASDPDGPSSAYGQQRFYFLNGATAGSVSSDGRYSIDSNTGTITTSAALDYETMTAPATYTVIARDNQGAPGYNQASASVTIGVANVNEAPAAPVVISLPPIAAESSSTWVASFLLSDPDGTVPTLRLVSNPDGAFAVFGNEIRFAGGTAPNFETLYAQRAAQGIAAVDSDNDGLWEISLGASIDATDGALSSPVVTGAIMLEDVNEAPVSLNWAPAAPSVAERDRVANGTALPAITLGTLSVTDPDLAGFKSGSYGFSVADSSFEIVGTTLRLREGMSFDFEAGPTVTVTVTATDQTAAPLSIQRTISIAVEDRDDVLQGDANANTLTGQQNRDLVYGFAGNDVLDGGSGDDDLFGGSGDDRGTGGAGADRLYGEDGADTLLGGTEGDLLDGGAEADTLFGDDGNDIVKGGIGDDILYGGAGADQLDGGDGSDWALYSSLTEGIAAPAAVTVDLLTPSANAGAAAGDTYVGIENVWGTAYGDTLRGNSTVNSIGGGGGDDVLEGRGGDDVIAGGAGADTIYGDYADDIVDGPSSTHTDHGGDALSGEAGNDTLCGGRGNDTLDGGDGDDVLRAEHDGDTLIGGTGNDVMYGGTGSDTYIVTRTSGADTIHNFDPTGTDTDVLGLKSTDGTINDADIWFEQVDSAGVPNSNGSDLKISVIGSTTSVTVKNWFPEASNSIYKIEFITTEGRYTRDVDVGGLVALMRTKTKPATTAARDAIMTDNAYLNQWANYWHTNQKPVVTNVLDQVMNEDGTLTFTIQATDDITPATGVSVAPVVIAGSSIIDSSNVVVSAPAADGTRTVTINPKANVAGVATLKLVATDAGGNSSETPVFTVTVAAVADAPTIAQFAATPGTAGQPGGIALSLNVSFPDTDGSEVHEITIAGVPAGVTLSAGTYDGAAALWRLTPAQLLNLKLNAPAGWSQDLTLTATARATENGSTATSAAKTATVVINAPPTGATLSGSAAENAANGTFIANVMGSDPDAGDTLSYALIDNSGGRFSISSAGALTVANGSLLNYEAAASHAITVRVTDSFGQYKDQALTVAVTNVNEQNVLGAIPAMSVNENVAAGTLVGTVPPATDPDSVAGPFGQQRYYFWNGSIAGSTSSDGRYAINVTTGQITTAAALNYEAGTPSATYTVIARDNAGAAGFTQASSTVTIGINNLNEQNMLGAIAPMSVEENVAVGTAVGTVPAATDPDGAGVPFGQQRYYFWDGTNANASSSDGRYSINAVTGQITTAAALNYEAGPASATYTVIARDNGGAAGYTQASSTVTIGIANVNEQTVLGTTPPMSVNENVALGTLVGTVPPATDPDGAAVAFGQQRYYFWNGATASATSSDGRYAINATTGQITTAAALNYEAGSAVATYTVIARDNAGAPGFTQASSDVTITVNNLNEQNALGAIPAMSVNENVGVGTLVGTVPPATDPDGAAVAFGQQRYYFWDGTNAGTTSSDGRYVIDAATGRITTAAALNYEAGPTSVTYTILARDNAGAAGYTQSSNSVTISIANVNEQTVLGTTPPISVNENVALGTLVGTVPPATDPDGAAVAFGQQRYYFWNGATASATSSDGRYAINATTGQITTAAALNYEAGAASVTYTVIARDNAGAPGFTQASSDVLISIVNVNEQNALGAIPPMSVNENLAVGTVVGTVPAATDPDGTAVAYGQQRYYFWDGANVSVSSSDGRYMIDAASGQITTATALNFEAGAPSKSYTVVARDNAGAAGYNQASSSVTIGINNVNEAPGTPLASPGFFFDETGLGLNPANAGVAVATFSLSDPDGTTPTLQFVAGTNPNNWFTIVGNQVRFNAGLNFDYESLRADGYAIGDFNSDGRLEALVATVSVYASDGQLNSSNASTKVYIQDVNERPNALTLQSQTLFSETVGSDTPHSWQSIARFGMSDPDQTIPALQIIGGNANGWFTTSGNQLTFAGANFTADWLRAYKGQYGTDPGYYYDNDGDGLLEIRVATLTLAAVDASGAQSDPFTYNVLIEDKNETPWFAANPFTFSAAENSGWYQYVGQVQGSDVDGPSGELRYVFSNASSYWDGNLGRQVTASADGRFVMDSIDGRVWVNGNQALDYEAVSAFSYQTRIYDKALGAHNLSTGGTLNINLQDVNEPHALQAASFTVNESSSPLGPMTPVPTSGGTVINLRSTMLSDPENRNMRWQFSDGSTSTGTWQLEQDGTLRMMGPVDYESMADWYEEHEYYDWEGNPYWQWDYMGRDPSRAVFNLGVQAIDDSTGVVREANLTLNIADVNEMPTFSTRVLDGIEGASGENQVYQDGTGVIRVYRRTRSRFAKVSGQDPDGKGGVSYQILGGSPWPTSTASFGTDSNLNGNGTPQIWIDGAGYMYLEVPGDSKDEWRGGVMSQKVTLTYTFTVRITDVDGGFSDVPMTITLYQRDIDVDPIVLDLDGDGIELVEIANSGASFDMDGDGVRDATGWVGSDDGLLVLDRDGNGAIEGIAEMSFRTADGNEASELEGLMRYDSNANGFFDAGDEDFDKFQVWQDSDGDGVSDAGELKTLGEMGITMINLTRTLTGQEQQGGNTIFSMSEYVRSDGTRGVVGDVFFIYEPSDFDGLAAPIVLDYDGDGSGLVSPGESLAAFDMDGDGSRERTGWIAAGDALLALDRNGDGLIAGIGEISFLGDRAGARTDLEGLAAFDSNGNGVIDTHDSKFAEFKLWFDNNGNGVSDTGEVVSLTEAGIRELSLSGQAVPESARKTGDNLVYAVASFTRDDGSTGSLLDAAFAYASASSAGGLAYSAEEAAPPPGSADVPAGDQDPPAAESVSAATASPTAPGVAAGQPVAEQAPPVAESPDASSPDATSAAQTARSITAARRTFERKSEKYWVAAQGGQLSVTPRKPKGGLDPVAGRIGPATLLSFKDKAIGMLAPVILDLDGDGIELVKRGKSKARFDMDGDGVRDDTGWIGKGDGILVIDRDNDGLITGAAELSFLAEKPDARSDLEALGALDSNRDRKIDATDLRFGELKVWVDSNRNGFTDAGELKTLQELGIASISLAAAANEAKVKPGENVLLATSSFTLTDGTVRSVGDAALAFKPSGRGSASAAALGGLPGGAVDRRLPPLPEGFEAEGDSNPGSAPELAQALRAGLDANGLSVSASGLSFDLPPGVDPFGAFAAPAAREPDPMQGPRAVPAMLAPAGNDDAPPSAADIHSIDDLRLALMVQQMAGFGRAAGENEWNQRGRPADSRYEYFA